MLSGSSSRTAGRQNHDSQSPGRGHLLEGRNHLPSVARAPSVRRLHTPPGGARSGVGDHEKCTGFIAKCAQLTGARWRVVPLAKEVPCGRLWVFRPNALAGDLAMQSGETSMELKALYQHGWSISALAREFGLNRRTVKRELESESPRQYSQRAKPTELSPAQLAHVERRLAVCPTIRGSDLHAELKRGYGYAGSYPAFARHLLTLRPLMVKEPEIRFETGPGVQTQADWADLGLWPLGDQMVELHAMVAVLGCSRRPALRMATEQTRPTTFERVVRCLDDLGGATKEILTDRASAFVIGTRHDRSAILAPEWVEVCSLLGVIPRTCRAYRAKTKGKVERVVKEVK